MTSRGKLPRRMWGGFCNDRLDFRLMDDEWGGENYRMIPALFTSYEDAREQYEDVRQVWVSLKKVARR